MPAIRAASSGGGPCPRSVPLPFGPPLASDPAAAERGRARWRAAAGARRRETDSERALLDALFGNAPFLAQCAARRPEVLAALLDEGADAAFARVRRELDSTMAAAPDGPDPDADAARALRRARLGAALVIARRMSAARGTSAGPPPR